MTITRKLQCERGSEMLDRAIAFFLFVRLLRWDYCSNTLLWSWQGRRKRLERFCGEEWVN